MTRVSLFNSPLLLGFEHFERALDRVNKGAERRLSALQYRADSARTRCASRWRWPGLRWPISTITIEDNQLVVRGKQTDDARARLSASRHRGAPVPALFVLAEGIEVRGAWLDNGLLHIDLVRPPIETRVRTVLIRGPETNPARLNGGRAAKAGRKTEDADGSGCRDRHRRNRHAGGERAGSALSRGVRNDSPAKWSPAPCRSARTRRDPAARPRYRAIVRHAVHRAARREPAVVAVPIIPSASNTMSQ